MPVESFLRAMGWAFLILGTCLAISFTIFSYAPSRAKEHTPTNGRYFECVYPYSGIYLPCTNKQRERDV